MPLDSKTMERIDDLCVKADLHLLNMNKDKDSFSVACEWSNFLSTYTQIFNVLGATCNAGQFKGWHDNLKNIKRNDPLLSYLAHARDADQHRIEGISEFIPPNVSWERPNGSTSIEQEDIVQIISSGKTIHIETKSQGMITIEHSDDVIRLLPVVDRAKNTYDLPTEHLGKPLQNQSPMYLGNTALQFIRQHLKTAP